MNQLIRLFGSAVLVAVLASACTSPNAKTASQAPIKPPPKPTPMSTSMQMGDVCFPEYDFSTLEQDVLIKYNRDSSIQSPISTLVPPTDQTYNFYFMVPMDRNSVERAIRNQDNDLHPHFTFTWMGTQQLFLSVDVNPARIKPGSNTYRLSIDGALTKSGRKVRHSPSLIAAVEQPRQLWRVSLDGQQREVLTSFDQPYTLELLDDGRSLFVTRQIAYSQGSVPASKQYFIYDMEKKFFNEYPVELQRSYMGEGTFVADKRGFFYAKPGSAIMVPKNDNAVEVKVNGYVHGASFTRDHKSVLMIVGDSAETNGKFRLVVQHLDTGKQEQLDKEIVANAPTSQDSNARIPVVFHDDGEYVYFQMQNPDGGLIHYQLDLKTMQTSSWTTTDQPDAWDGIKASTDDLYRLYPNAGLYKANQKVSQEMNLFNGQWITGTHQIAVRDFDSKADPNSNARAQLKLYDADQQKFTEIASGMPSAMEVLGSSNDGKWIYVSTSGDLNKK